MLPVLWSSAAEADLLEIILFIGERDPFAAERLGVLVRESTWPLSEHPYLFKRSERMPDCRELVIHPNYVLVYRIGAASIEVLRILHSRQKYPA